MKQSDKYNKVCPVCETVFVAKHMSRVYDREKCKREAFRAKKQEKREEESDDRLALTENDQKLGKLFALKKPFYSKLDLESVKFDPTCYYRCYQVENTKEYVLERFILKELAERKFKIYKHV